MPIVCGDQELQGGGAHPETRGASTVAAAQGAGSVHTSHSVAAAQAGCSNIVVAATVMVS
uniref:Uncharacterized protein n=1 Tax=Arundo donax TaxID=35708 RepID=A0A0A9G064_ARUDO